VEEALHLEGLARVVDGLHEPVPQRRLGVLRAPPSAAHGPAASGRRAGEQARRMRAWRGLGGSNGGPRRWRQGEHGSQSHGVVGRSHHDWNVLFSQLVLLLLHLLLGKEILQIPVRQQRREKFFVIQ
jgi:hypothetical protein